MEEEFNLALDNNISLMKNQENMRKKSKADDLLIVGEFDVAFDLYRQLVKEDNYKGILQSRSKFIERYNDLRQRANEDLVIVKVDSTAEKSLANKIEILKTSHHLTVDSLSELFQRKIEVLNDKLSIKPILKELSFYSIHGTKTIYFGEIQNNKANGEGMGYYRSGNVYIGTWKNNLREGKSGTYYFLNGDRYEGNYLKDRREGTGTYYWASGDRYEGEWLNDKRNGYGVLYGSDNKVKMKGTWKNDELIQPEN
tara:strand:+ start:3812 stop:4573 length:762 start_codon:yes stop_codon:yes gene_type:complete